MNTGMCFTLNEVGALIWERVGAGDTMTAIQEAVCRQYAVDAGVAKKDAEKLLLDLLEKGLLQPAAQRTLCAAAMGFTRSKVDSAIQWVLRAHRRYRHHLQEERFDAQYGVDTVFRPQERSAQRDGISEKMFYPYDPSKKETFHSAVASLPIDPERFTFIDIGSGKGRALLMASEFPFKRIIGVEISPALNETAKTNVVLYQRKATGRVDIELFCANALDFPLPEGPLVLYLFNPFNGDALSQFLERVSVWLAHSPRELFLIYVSPLYRHALDQAAAFRLVREVNAESSYERYCIYTLQASG